MDKVLRDAMLADEQAVAADVEFRTSKQASPEQVEEHWDTVMQYRQVVALETIAGLLAELTAMLSLDMTPDEEEKLADE